MKLQSRVALNTIIQFLSKAVSIVFGLLTISLIARYLSPTGFGEYTTIMTFLSFFAVAADLGLTLVTVQMLSQPDIDRDETLSNLFSLRFFSALFFLLLGPLVVLFFPYSNEIKIGVAIAWSSYFFIALNQVMVGLFQKELRLDKVSIAEIASRAFLLIGTIYTIKAQLGLKGIIWINTLANLLSFAIHYFFAKKFAQIKLKINWRVWKAIIIKSWPIGLTIVFNLIYLRADTLLLSIFKTQTDVGVYGLAYKVIDVLITLPFIFAGIVLPIMTSAWLTNQKQRFNNLLQKSFDLMVIIAVPQFFGTYFLADQIIGAVAGAEYAVAGSILRVLIIASCIIFIGTVFSHGVIAIDKQRQIIGAYLFVAITALIGYFLFIPRYSYFGAAWVTIYSELVIALASYFIVWKSSNFVPRLNIFWKSILASLVMSLGLISLKTLPVLLNIFLGASLYIVTLFILRGLTKKDLSDLIARS